MPPAEASSPLDDDLVWWTFPASRNEWDALVRNAWMVEAMAQDADSLAAAASRVVVRKVAPPALLVVYVGASLRHAEHAGALHLCATFLSKIVGGCATQGNGSRRYGLPLWVCWIGGEEYALESLVSQDDQERIRKERRRRRCLDRYVGRDTSGPPRPRPPGVGASGSLPGQDLAERVRMLARAGDLGGAREAQARLERDYDPEHPEVVQARKEVRRAEKWAVWISLGGPKLAKPQSAWFTERCGRAPAVEPGSSLARYIEELEAVHQDPWRVAADAPRRIASAVDAALALRAAQSLLASGAGWDDPLRDRRIRQARALLHSVVTWGEHRGEPALRDGARIGLVAACGLAGLAAEGGPGADAAIEEGDAHLAVLEAGMAGSVGGPAEVVRRHWERHRCAGAASPDLARRALWDLVWIEPTGTPRPRLYPGAAGCSPRGLAVKPPGTGPEGPPRRTPTGLFGRSDGALPRPPAMIIDVEEDATDGSPSGVAPQVVLVHGPAQPRREVVLPWFRRLFRHGDLPVLAGGEVADQLVKLGLCDAEISSEEARHPTRWGPQPIEAIRTAKERHPEASWTFVPPKHARRIFFNVPYDDGYRPTLDLLRVIAVGAGFRPVVAGDIEERASASAITKHIGRAHWSVHDLRRILGDPLFGTARLNMPFELGSALSRAAPRRGGRVSHQVLVLAPRSHPLERSLSDLVDDERCLQRRVGGRHEAGRALRDLLAWVTGQTLPVIAWWDCVAWKYRALVEADTLPPVGPSRTRRLEQLAQEAIGAISPP
ncbi:hypothetical protein L6R50_12250 [Myxococcota bacterium]|nr:hypothetical protein [Myxococcota bacterium]